MPRAQDSTARALPALLFLRSLRSAASAAAIAAATAGCSTRGAPVEAPIDVTVAPLASDAGIVPLTTNRNPASCTVRLRAGRIDKSSPGCVIDEQISSTTGVLTYPCHGDGAVEAEFGKQRYSGVLVNGEVELTLETELDWEDGCRWGTRAVIKGTLLSRNGDLTTKPIPWTYRDSVLTGSDCSGACTARSSFQVLASKASTPSSASPEDHDEDTD